MSYWSKLSMKDRANVMKLFLDKGISDLDTMRREYNLFAEGGNTNDADLVDWIIREEGFNKKPEDIGDGKMTLGSGLTSKKWHDLYRKRGNKWSAEDNRMAVAEEVANRRRWAEKTIPNWEALPDSSQKALLSYKYNYDFTPTNSPKLFKALADSNFREAARQMDATSKDPKFKEGLMKRRLREQEWFLSDLANQSIPEPTPAPAPVVINTSLPDIVAPAVSTAVANNYIPSSVHPYTRRENARRAMESAAAFNRMIEDTSIQNNLSEYQFPIGNGYANGGKIHIKPSHRGRLTELKKRTGKSEAELYKTGGPAVRKMITFARNARKWKHSLGGNLYDDGGSYSYTKPLDNVYVDSEGNLLDPDVPSARGTVQLPEIIASTRDPRKPIPTDFSKDLNDAIFNISRHLMQYGRNKSVLAPTSTEFNIIDNEPIEGMAQATYLTPRNIQKQKFLEAGYTEAPRDYGLVKKAVGDRNIPVYQKRPDDEKRENLIAIGNIDTEWFGKDRAELRHAGSYPTAVYINPENSKVYQKAWDLNDYGGNTGTAKAYSPMRKLEANVIDKIGSPVVVTSGISEVDNENIKGSLESVLDDFMYNKGLTRYRDYIKEEIPMNNIHGEPMYNPDGTRVYTTGMKPFTYYGLPEVTVYGKMKKGTTYLLTPSIVSKKK